VTAQPPQSQAPPIRQPSGVNRERLAPIIVSVLHKFVLRLHNQNIVVSITGGLQVCVYVCVCVIIRGECLWEAEDACMLFN
jgi:predicted ATP-dependent serine protease